MQEMKIDHLDKSNTQESQNQRSYFWRVCVTYWTCELSATHGFIVEQGSLLETQEILQ